MKYTDIQLIKRNVKSLTTVFCTILLLAIYACNDAEVAIAPIDTEPHAALGFDQEEGITIEGGIAGVYNAAASKNLFEDVSFDIEVLNGDGSDIIITDANGNTGTTFSIASGTKTNPLTFTKTEDSKFVGDQVITYGLTNLKGNGAFILDRNLGSDGRKLYYEFELTVIEDELEPPSIGFERDKSEVDEASTDPKLIKIVFSEPAPRAGTFDLAVTGTAIADVDYTSEAVNGKLPVAFDIGDTEVFVSITTINNEDIEEDRTVVLTFPEIGDDFLVRPNAVHTLTILDDDVPKKVTEIITEADAWTRGRNGSSKSDENGGDKTELVASNDTSDNNFRQFFVRFDLTGIDPSKVIDAKVVLTTIKEDGDKGWEAAESNAGEVTTQTIYHVTDDSWGEMTVTANNQPVAEISPLASFTSEFLLGGSGLTNIEHEFDVTSLMQVEADGKLSIKLIVENITSGKRIFYSSREGDGAFVPKLIITESL